MNPLEGTGRYLSEIAAALISVAALGLIITNSQGFATATGAVAKGFGSLLSVATFQNNSFANVFNGL